MSDIATLGKKVNQQQKQIDAAVKGVNTIIQKLENTPATGFNPQSIFGAPHIRSGEDPLTSRGFSFGKMMGLLTGACTPEQAKVEMDIHNRLNQCYVKELGGAAYTYGGVGREGVTRFLAPLSTSFMHDNFVSRDFRQEMKSLVTNGVAGADQDEMSWIRRKVLEGHYGQKALSWLNETAGGALVQPPEQGELIELLRNKEALINAGAKTIPLPPQGRLKFPRQTSASTTYWIGENAPITESEIGVGEITLQAKKLAVRIIAPNELIRFASPAAEALIRDDMTKSLALGLDLAGLEGAGTDTQPRGIINYPNINRITSSTPGANGDTIVGQDIYRFISIIEESNAEFEGFIMRPKTLYKFYQLRADAVAQGDGSGVFLFNLIREGGDGFKPTLGGYPVTKSTQVSQVQSKGSASNLTYILGGAFSEIILGMFGAIEFAATTQGDTAFTNDQTWVRGILSADVQLRHEASLVLMEQLIANAV